MPQNLDEPRSVARNEYIAAGSKADVPRATFHEQSVRPSYAFQGLAPYVDREAERRRFADHSLRNRIKGDWFLTQASNALGNACFQKKREDAEASIDRAIQMRESLALALAATEAAIIDTARNLSLEDPPFARRPEPTDAPARQLRRPRNQGE